MNEVTFRVKAVDATGEPADVLPITVVLPADWRMTGYEITPPAPMARKLSLNAMYGPNKPDAVSAYPPALTEPQGGSEADWQASPADAVQRSNVDAQGWPIDEAGRRLTYRPTDLR